jgi:hypothetical protein
MMNTLGFTPPRFSEKHIDIYGKVKGEAIKFQNLQGVKTQLLSWDDEREWKSKSSVNVQFSERTKISEDDELRL